MDVFDLFAKITLDSSEYKEGLEEASEKSASFSSRLKEGIGTAAKVGVAAIGTITTATTAMGTALVKGVGSVAEYGDNIDKMSQKMGLSASAYQEWDAVMQHSGTSIDSMARGMTTLSKAAENNSDAFKALGISQEEIASMNQEELFARTIEGLQGMEAGTERTVLAQKLLGGAAKELGPLLNTSAEDTAAMRDRVRELGGVMSDEAIKAAAAYQDQLQDMTTAFQGISRSMLSEFMPSMTTVISGLTEIFGGNGEAGVALVTQGVNGIIQGLNEALPRISQIGGNILSAIGSAIQENIPTIIQAGTEMIINLGGGMISALPSLVKTLVSIGKTVIKTIMNSAPAMLKSGVDLIGEMSDGMLKNLPDAISALFDIISEMLAYILQNFPQFLEKGVELVGRIATGILNNLPAIVSAIAKGMAQLLSTIVSNMPQFLMRGIELVGKIAIGIVQNIPAAVNSIGKALKELLATIADSMPAFLSRGVKLVGEIASGIVDAIPRLVKAIGNGIKEMKDKLRNTDWASVGIQIMKGVANGIRDGLSNALNAMGKAAKNLLDEAKNVLGIKSPSTVFRNIIGKNIGAGMAQGILDSIPLVNSAMQDLDEELVSGVDELDYGLDTNVTTLGDNEGSNGNRAYNNTVTINVYGAQGQDVNDLADIVMERLTFLYDREEAAYVTA